MWIFELMPLLRVGFDIRMRIPIHSSPMLQVNCPILHAVGLPTPLAILEPPINPTHICNT